MTGCSRNHGLMRGLGRLAAMALAACACACQMGGSSAPVAFSSDQSTIQMISTNVGGKNVYIPGTVVVASGKPHTLSIFNTTDTPHGFSIDGLGIQTVLLSREEHEVSLPALDAGRIYHIRCQLHPPHRTATLVVVPGE